MNQQELQTSDSEQSTLPLRTVTESAEHENVVVEEEEMEAKEETEADSLSVLLQKEAHARFRETLAAFAWSGVFMTALVMSTRFAVEDSRAQMGTYCLQMISLGLILAAYLFHRSYRRKHRLTGALAQAHNVRHIGSLIEATRVESLPARNLAKQSLISLLPTMQASDAPLLTKAHRERLLWFLAISPNDKGYRDLKELFSTSARQREIDLRIAILKALEQVGGAKELPTVERLSRGQTNLQSASLVPQEVKDAACECLPFLQARAGEQRASEQLLRASSAHAMPNDILLRPADFHADAAPEQLLRASKTVR